jgi:hypothetical protein
MMCLLSWNTERRLPYLATEGSHKALLAVKVEM